MSMKDLVPIKVYCSENIVDDSVPLLKKGVLYKLTGFMACTHCGAFYVRVDVLEDNRSSGKMYCYNCREVITFEDCQPLPANIFSNTHEYYSERDKCMVCEVISYDNDDIRRNVSFDDPLLDELP